jgi:hypothetical protein
MIEKDKSVVEGDAVDTVLDIPFSVTVLIKEPKFCDRFNLKMWKRKDSHDFFLKKIRYASLLKISKILLNVKGLHDLKDLSIFQAGILTLAHDGEKILDILTLAFHNQDSEPPKWLRNFFKRNLDSEDLFKLSHLVIKKMGVEHFIYTIIAWKAVSLLKAGESIAPGDLSEASKNTSDTTENISSGD